LIDDRCSRFDCCSSLFFTLVWIGKFLFWHHSKFFWIRER